MKKIISFLLVIAILSAFSAVTVFAGESYSLTKDSKSVADVVKSLGDVETYRYYFLVPNGENGPVGTTGDYKGQKVPTWINEFNDKDGDGVLDVGPGLYWFDAPEPVPNPDWTGYRVEKGDAEGVYYADVPVDVTTMVLNNGINAGMDPTAPIFTANGQSSNILCEYYDPGESPLYPDGTENFDGMIIVLDPNKASKKTDVSPVPTFGYEWYYYYGNGHYGTTKFEGDTPDETFIEENCCNPDHDHIMKGDADKDRRVSIYDVAAIQLYLAGRNYPDSFSETNADADSDGEITINDATTVQRYLARLIEKL